MMVEWQIDIFMPVETVFSQVEIAADLPAETFIAEFDAATIFRADRIAIFLRIIEKITAFAGGQHALRRYHPVIATPGRHRGKAADDFVPVAEAQVVLLVEFKQRKDHGGIKHAGTLNVMLLGTETRLLLEQVRMGRVHIPRNQTQAGKQTVVTIIKVVPDSTLRRPVQGAEKITVALHRIRAEGDEAAERAAVWTVARIGQPETGVQGRQGIVWTLPGNDCIIGITHRRVWIAVIANRLPCFRPVCQDMNVIAESTVIRKRNLAAVGRNRRHESPAKHIADLGYLLAGQIVCVEVENAAAVGRKIQAAAIRAPHRASVNGAVMHQFLELVALAVEDPDVLAAIRLPDSDRDFLPVRAEARRFELVRTVFAKPVDILFLRNLFLRQRQHRKPRIAKPAGHEHQPGAVRQGRCIAGAQMPGEANFLAPFEIVIIDVVVEIGVTHYLYPGVIDALAVTSPCNALPGRGNIIDELAIIAAINVHQVYRGMLIRIPDRISYLPAVRRNCRRKILISAPVGSIWRQGARSAQAVIKHFLSGDFKASVQLA